MLDKADFYAMIEMVAGQMAVSALPLTVRAAMRPDEYGAPDLLGSFSRRP